MKKTPRRLTIAAETLRQLRRIDREDLRLVAGGGAEAAVTNVEVCTYTTHPTL